MSKGKSVFRCTECGADQPKWGGKCDACGAWNSLVEEAVGRLSGSAVQGVPTGQPPIRLTDLKQSAVARWKTGLAEFDFVLGGGIVPGSVILVGGEPGIGKSTLLMQCAARLESQGVSTLYVSGEESPDQLRLRADRLEEDAGGIHVLGETRLESILHHATQLKSSVVLLDSVQTTYTEELEGAPGNVGQVRECAARLMRFAKESGPAVVLVANPAAAFLAGRSTGASGSAVTALMEGTRPMLVEIQALASKAGFGTPQRVATGLDHRRLALLLAVLERRGGLPFGNLDVFVNVTGGVRLIEPSTDLAVLAALVSTVHDRPVPADALFLGEVGLGGEIRPVAGVERRLAEAARQGFRRVFLSARSRGTAGAGDLEVIGLEGIGELTRRLAA